MSLLEGKDPLATLKEKFVPALKIQFMLWPLVQTVNFKFVPVPGQVLVVNFVSLGEFGGFLFAVFWRGDCCLAFWLWGSGWEMGWNSRMWGVFKECMLTSRVSVSFRMELLPELPQQPG